MSALNNKQMVLAPWCYEKVDGLECRGRYQAAHQGGSRSCKNVMHALEQPDLPEGIPYPSLQCFYCHPLSTLHFADCACRHPVLCFWESRKEMGAVGKELLTVGILLVPSRTFIFPYRSLH